MKTEEDIRKEIGGGEKKQIIGCPVCGNTEIQRNYKFCQICGHSIEKMIYPSDMAELCRVQKAYAAICAEVSVAGIDKDYVHLAPETFLATFGEYSRKIWDGDYDELSTSYDGVKFICLVNKEGAKS